MLEALKVIILGIVEGITEWLPISSTGHLILVEEFIKLEQSEAFIEMFNVVIQLGAILAVVVIYFHKLNPFSPKKTQKQKTSFPTPEKPISSPSAEKRKPMTSVKPSMNTMGKTSWWHLLTQRAEEKPILMM